MIVKDESAVIERCLNSVKPLIDYWVIVDTGSTDGTQELIKETLKDIPGELYEQPWVNFGYNRTQALEFSKNKADYLLIIDADDWLEYEKDYSFPHLRKDAYTIWRGNKNFSYLTTQLIKANLPWKWVGVLHEYLDCKFPISSETLRGIKYIQTVEGSRSQDPQKYWKHVKLLEEGLKEEPENKRYVFYLAESYRDAGDLVNAIKWYQKRVEMGDWAEEVYWSLLQIAKLKRAQNDDPESIIEAFYRAYRYRPHRMEASYYLAEFYNQSKRFDLAYACLKACSFCPPQKDSLFNEEWIERWGLLFQLSLSSYYLGHYQESLDLCDTLLSFPNIPENFREQIRQNRLFPLQKLNLDEKKVLLAILARNKAHVLPTFLKSIENLDYNKKAITVYINTNNNSDNTKEILEEWIEQNKENYQAIIFEHHEIDDMPVTNPHEWTPKRWNILGHLRNESLKKTKEYNCDYYFVVDCDNFIEPCTLKELINKDKPIVAPLLRSLLDPRDVYSNFFLDIDGKGYYKDHPDYYKILNREKIGTFKAPVVHHAYLIKSEVIEDLNYIDDSSDWEFIIFSRNARAHGVDQYICNEKYFGTFLHFSNKVSLEDEKKAFQEFSIKRKDPLYNRLSSNDKRFSTFKRALQLMEERQVKTIVETGTSRDGEKNFEGDGGSTILFGDWACQYDAFLYSIDINEEAIRQAKLATLPFHRYIQFLCMDSVSLLQQFPGKIDFLYLDSFDFDASNPLPSQRHHLKEIEAAYDKLTSKSIVMIDDCKLPHGGKGKEVIAFLLERGWEVIEEGYQVILAKKTEDILENTALKLLQKAREQERLKKPLREVVDHYLKAYQYSSHIEPLYYLCRYYRTNEQYEQAFQTAFEGVKNLENALIPPLEQWIYEHGMLWEFSLSAHATGRFQEAIDATKKLLDNANVSQEKRALLEKNMIYYRAGVQVEEFSKQKWGSLSQKKNSEPQLHVCTVATHSCQGLDQFLNSCKSHQIKVEIFGFGQPFSFGKKLQYIQEYVETLADDDIVLFLDGFDTLVLADEKTIVQKFLSMNAPFVISTERNCHPFPHLANYYPKSPTSFKYLNSGSYIGYAGYIKRIMREISPIADETDDQGLLTAFYLYHPYFIKLDYACELFLTLSYVEESQIAMEEKNVRCLETNSIPCVVHGNGAGKMLYQRIYDQIFN